MRLLVCRSLRMAVLVLVLVRVHSEHHALEARVEALQADKQRLAARVREQEQQLRDKNPKLQELAAAKVRKPLAFRSVRVLRSSRVVTRAARLAVPGGTCRQVRGARA